MTGNPSDCESECSDSDVRAAMGRLALLEMLLQEHMDEHGPCCAQKLLLGEAEEPPADLLREIREAKRDLEAMRLSSRVTRLLGILEKAEGRGTAPLAPTETLTVQQAAALLDVGSKTLQNRISAQKRQSGRDFEWVLRAGRKRGCVIDRRRFMAWLEQSPRRRGRPPGRA